jgi:carbon-monoxide dehydrogenase medium subunit
MYPSSFEYIAATSLDEALAALADNPGSKVMSGGMSLIPLMKLRLFSPSVVVDIGRVPGLDAITDSGDHLAIGALVRHAATASSDAVKSGAAALAQAAAVLALGATMVARSASGERTIPAADFFVDTLTSALQPDEILVEVRVPKTGSGTGSAYGKLGRRGGQSDYAVAGAAAVVTMDGDNVAAASVALTGVGTKPTLATGVAEALVGTDGSAAAVAEASGRAVEGVTVLEDLYGSEEYKSHLAQLFAARAINAAIAAAT